MEKGVPLDAWVVFRFNWLPGSFFLRRFFNNTRRGLWSFSITKREREKASLIIPSATAISIN